MISRGYTGITKPSFLRVNPDASILIFWKPYLTSVSTRLTRKFSILANFQHSAADITISSNSISSSVPRHETISLERGRFDSSSSYTTSLFQVKNERMVSRAAIYEFLRGIGIVTDELDGLELPLTVEVMRERIDFLHKLGLTIEDINNYPLVLGCSIKKNMIPVLDYLGKLGVRKSTFTNFLRRYPQVLHASVVVDLQPVVSYLQGVDIKPDDIPLVLERYPEVLGLKLEGTMSTSVAYLVGIGVSRREIGTILTAYPEILGMRVGTVIKPFVEYLESLGFPRLDVARLIENRPHILGFRLEETVKPNVESLLEYNVRKALLASVIAQFPEIIGIDLKPKLLTQQTFLGSIIELNPEDFGRVVEKMPQISCLSSKSTLRHVDFLKGCGFCVQEIRKMVIRCPHLLALNLDFMELNFQYFQTEMGRALDELVAFPAFFTYSLESTIKPRHLVVAEKGLKCSLEWLLGCSAEKFKERMSYDTIGMEEMEMEMEMEPSSEMDTPIEPRSDGSDSDYMDDSDEYV